MSDDERLARELQQMEYDHARQAPTNAMGVVQGVPPGGAVPVVQGTALPGQQVGYGGYDPTLPSGTPTVIGIGQPGSGYYAPHAVAVVPDIPPEEAIVLNYRLSLLCFTMIDAVSTMLNALSFIRTPSDDEDDDDRVSMFGHRGIIKDEQTRVIIGLCGLLFLFGPICGFFGANRFNRPLVTVYLFFCIAKTFFEVALAILTPWLWFILIALIQVWVTKIVSTFWTALGRIPPDKIKALRDPNYINTVRARVVYW